MVRPKEAAGATAKAARKRKPHNSQQEQNRVDICLYSIFCFEGPCVYRCSFTPLYLFSVLPGSFLSTHISCHMYVGWLAFAFAIFVVSIFLSLISISLIFMLRVFFRRCRVCLGWKIHRYAHPHTSTRSVTFYRNSLSPFSRHRQRFSRC